MLRAAVPIAVAITLQSTALIAQEWKPAAGPLQTQWAKDVSPLTTWPEHPRPLQKRSRWQNLNGLWDYAITAADAAMPETADGSILVPFPLESSLSGVMRALKPDQRLWYRRSFELGAANGDRILLHFGAVDHSCEVFVDGKSVGTHTGGYDPITFDITRALRGGRSHTLLVGVRDPSDAGPQPRGKQVQKPGGIWYTACSGIWQTVWLEGVPDTYVSDLTVDGSRATGKVTVKATAVGDARGLHWSARVFDQAQVVAEGTAPLGEAIALQLEKPRAWSPHDPFRYGLQVRTFRGDNNDDQGGGDWVDSYFALRDLTVGRDGRGHTRLLLNGEPLFLFGPLDQGYWPDGLYTPPSFAAMQHDLEATLAMGCNMLRKHAKVESELFYAECDKRGIVVLQDMPSGSTHDDPAGFERELRALIAARGRHPSIAMWVVFNEGWGQHDTERYCQLVRGLDASRWLGNASGWTDKGCGDVIDLHIYPGPGMPAPEAARAAMLGEFGGLGLPLPGHTWVGKDNWGYVQYEDQAALTTAYAERVFMLRPLIARGLSAAVYTQTTDVEVECNGWFTYDRAIAKIDPLRAAAAARSLQQPPGNLVALLPAAVDGAPVAWRVAPAAPADGWQRPEFDDSGWREGKAGFGTEGTPGSAVGTRWDSPAIWLRTTIELPAGPVHEPLWCIHHDEDIEVHLDGELVFSRRGYATAYEWSPVAESARARLTPGRHVLAVHCRQTGGGQFVDVGLYDLAPAKPTSAR